MFIAIFYLFFRLCFADHSNVGGTTISVLQYNLMLWEDTIGEPFQHYKDSERRDQIVKVINESSFDIVAIEECWSDKIKEDVADQLKEKYPYSVIIKTPHYDIGNGLLFLSSYEIMDHYFVKFETLVGIDRFSQKGYIGLWMEIPSGNSTTGIRVFHSHTQSGEEHTEARLDNLLQIYEGFQLYNPDLPGLIVGDLNIAFTKNNWTEYNDMMKLFPMMIDTFSPDVFVPTVDPTTNTMAHKYDSEDLPERDDYILVAKDKWEVLDHGVIYDKFKLEDGNDCSDHYPIFSTIQLVV